MWTGGHGSRHPMQSGITRGRIRADGCRCSHRPGSMSWNKGSSLLYCIFWHVRCVLKPDDDATESLRDGGVPVLDRFLDDLHELVGDGAVDDPMVVPDGHVGPQPDSDSVVNDHWPLLYRADADDRDLRLADNRHSKQRAEHTRVGDR